MKIVSDFGGDYKDGYNTALHIEEHSEDDGDTVFFHGIQCGIDKKLLQQHKNYKRKILLDLWSPCQFFVEPNIKQKTTRSHDPFFPIGFRIISFRFF